MRLQLRDSTHKQNTPIDNMQITLRHCVALCPEREVKSAADQKENEHHKVTHAFSLAISSKWFNKNLDLLRSASILPS